MAIDNFVTIEGNLRDVYRQLQPGTMQHADQLMNERRTNEELRNQRFYTADGVVYFLDTCLEIPTLAVTKEANNPVLQNIDAAFDQLVNKHNYKVSQADVQQAVAAPDTVLIALPNLRLSTHDAEFSYLPIGTTPSKYGQLNNEERKFAELVYGQRDDFTKNMKMLKEARISETYIWVLNPDYVCEHTEKGAIARASWLKVFSNDSRFNADGRNISIRGRVRGIRRGSEATEMPAEHDVKKIDSEERILQPVTKELILPVAQPYISGYDWKTFLARIPDHAPALGDVLLAAHKDSFVCDFARPEFDLKIRELYFPPPKKEEK